MGTRLLPMFKLGRVMKPRLNPSGAVTGEEPDIEAERLKVGRQMGSRNAYAFLHQQSHPSTVDAKRGR